MEKLLLKINRVLLILMILLSLITASILLLGCNNEKEEIKPINNSFTGSWEIQSTYYKGSFIIDSSSKVISGSYKDLTTNETFPITETTNASFERILLISGNEYLKLENITFLKHDDYSKLHVVKVTILNKPSIVSEDNTIGLNLIHK